MRDTHTRMIFDSDERFPESCVLYTHFESYSLRQMFAYLREKETFLQADCKKYDGTPMGDRLRARLEEVEAQLIFMAHNLR